MAEEAPERRRRRSPRRSPQAATAPTEASEALRAAGAMLARRGRTEREVRDKLRTKGFDQPIIDTALDRLRNAGLINDHKHAHDFARSLAARRGLGPQAVREQLLRRGVPRSIADEVSAQWADPERQTAQARQAVASYLARQRDVPEDVRRRRLYALLRRRGFEDEVVREVLSDVVPED